VTSHIIGPDLASIHRAWFAGQREEAAHLFLKTLPLTQAIFSAPSPAPLKYAMEALGVLPAASACRWWL
jgi:4-hydroxy-tetrahydrodipicolinate synthase